MGNTSEKKNSKKTEGKKLWLAWKSEHNLQDLIVAAADKAKAVMTDNMTEYLKMQPVETSDNSSFAYDHNGETSLTAENLDDFVDEFFEDEGNWFPQLTAYAGC